MDLNELKNSIARLIKEDKYPDAFIECGKALRLDARDEEIIKICGFLFNRIQDAHIEINCTNAEEYTMRGIANFYNGKMDNSFYDYNKAIEIDSNYHYAYKCRHMIFASMGKINEAIRDLQMAIKINPTGEYYNDFGTLLGLLQKKNESLTCYLRAVELSPEVAQYWYNFGVELMNQGYLQDAIVKYNKAIELWPDYEDAQVNLRYVQSLLNKN